MAQARCRFSALQIFTTIAKTPSMCKQLIRIRNSDGVPVILASCLRTLHFKSSQCDPHSVQVSLHLLRNLLLPPENRRTIGAFVLDTTTPVSSTAQSTSAQKVSSAPAPAPAPPQTVFQILRSWIKHKDPNVQMSAAVILRLLVSECAENVLRLSDGLLLDDMLSMPLERTHPHARVEHARFLAITLKSACGSIETAPPLPPAATGTATAATASAITTPSATGTDTTAVDAATSAVKTLALDSPSGAVLSRVGSLVSLQRICFLLASSHTMLHKEALTALLAAEEAARTGHDCCKPVYGLMGSSVAKASTSSSSQSIAADAFKLNGESLETVLERLAADHSTGPMVWKLLSKLKK